jgi:hypothetical protein
MLNIAESIPPIPELDGIRGNAAEFRPIPESLELIPVLEFSALIAVWFNSGIDGMDSGIAGN